MEWWVRKRFIREFLQLPREKQDEVLALMREFERARKRTSLQRQHRNAGKKDQKAI